MPSLREGRGERHHRARRRRTRPRRSSVDARSGRRGRCCRASCELGDVVLLLERRDVAPPEDVGVAAGLRLRPRVRLDDGVLVVAVVGEVLVVVEDEDVAELVERRCSRRRSSRPARPTSSHQRSVPQSNRCPFCAEPHPEPVGRVAPEAGEAVGRRTGRRCRSRRRCRRRCRSRTSAPSTCGSRSSRRGRRGSRPSCRAAACRTSVQRYWRTLFWAYRPPLKIGSGSWATAWTAARAARTQRAPPRSRAARLIAAPPRRRRRRGPGREDPDERTVEPRAEDASSAASAACDAPARAAEPSRPASSPSRRDRRRAGRSGRRARVSRPCAASNTTRSPAIVAGPAPRTRTAGVGRRAAADDARTG